MNMLEKCVGAIMLVTTVTLWPSAQTNQTSTTTQGPPAPTHANLLRGEYGRYRANNDLLFYDLDIRVDPEKKFVNGKNTIRFKMLSDDTRIQLDLYDNLKIDQILFYDGPRERQLPPSDPRTIKAVPSQLKYERDSGAVFVDFPKTLRTGSIYEIDFFYSGTPQTIGRFGGFTFGKDPAGRPWIFTACEGEGASIWWPNKDQWKDEVESMRLSVAVPNGLTDVSNGKFMGTSDLHDGYTEWNWEIQYPINNYNVSVNIGKYEHWSDRVGDVPLDFYALPEDLERAKKQFAQARGDRGVSALLWRIPVQERWLQVNPGALFRDGASERGHIRQSFCEWLS